jgi:hypothetical protein
MYLRLYGVLNAVYLQISAFEELACLLNFSGRKKVQELFYQLDIYKLRNIVAAHTLNYQYDLKILGKEKTTSFRIYQADLEETGSNIKVLSEHGNLLSYNLIYILTEYEIIARDLLIKMAKFAINSLVIDTAYKKELNERLDALLPNLIQYEKINKNKVHIENEIKRQKNKFSKISSLTKNFDDVTLFRIAGMENE